jgi:hypothetical protein
MAKYRKQLLAARDRYNNRQTSSSMSKDNLLSNRGRMYEVQNRNTYGYTPLSKRFDNLYKKALDYYNNDAYKGFYDTYSGTRKNDGSYAANTGAWYSDLEKQSKEANEGIDELLAELDQYSRYYNEDAVKYLRGIITERQKSYDDIMTDAGKFRDHWSQWATEDDYNAALRDYDIYTAYESGKYDKAEELLKLKAGDFLKKNPNFLNDPEALKEYGELMKEEENLKQAREFETYKPFWDYLDAKKYTDAAEFIKDLDISDEKKAQYQSVVDYYKDNGNYLALMKNEDFEANSAYKTTKEGDPEVSYVDTFLSGETKYKEDYGYTDITYDLINGDEDAHEYAMLNDIQNYGIWGLPYSALSSDYLTLLGDNEKKIFNYIYKTQSPEAAYAYISHLEGKYLNYRFRKEIEERAAKMAMEDPVGSSFATIALSPLKGASFITQTMDYLDDGELTKDAPYNSTLYTSNKIRQTISNDIVESGKWGKVGSFAYNVGMSMGDFLVAAGVGGGGSTAVGLIMASGAAADTTLNGIDRGLDSTRAYTSGIVAGVAEFFVEKLGMERFLNFSKLGKTAGARILNMSMAEGVEEGLTNLVNWGYDELYDVLSGQNMSELKQRTQKIMKDENISESEAFGKAIGEKLLEVVADTLAGMVSGAALGGGAAIATNINAYNEGGKYKSDPAALIEEALRLDPNDKYAQRLKKKLEEGKKVTRTELGKLSFSEIETTATAMSESDKAARNERYETFKKKLSSGIADENTRSQMAETITKIAYGENVSNSELRKIVGNQKALNVLEGVIGTKYKVGDITVRDLRKAIAPLQNNAARLSSGNILGTVSALFDLDEAAERSLAVSYATAVRNATDGKVTTPEQFAAVYGTVYQAGKRGADISAMPQEIASMLPESAIQQAYKAGQLEAKKNSETDLSNGTESGTINTNAKEAENGEGIHLRDSGERNRGTNPQGQVSAVEGNARQNQGRRKGGAGPRDSEAASLSYDGEEVSAKSRGIENGLESGKVRLVAEGSETASMKEAKKIAAKYGLNVTFFGGGNLKIASGEEIISARAYIQGNDVYIRVDHPVFTADQLMRHEAGHYMIAKGEINVADVRKLINERFTPEEIDAISKAYAIAYAKTELKPDQIWEEIICDSLAEMNAFEGIEGLEASAEMAADFLPYLREATLESRKEATGPPKTQEGKASREFGEYTKEQYESFGWVRANNILSAGYWKNFTANFADAVANKHYFPKTKSGEFMIETYNVYDSEGVADVIVVARGTIDSPNISKVVKINATQKNLDNARRLIYESAGRGIQQETGELFQFYDKTAYVFSGAAQGQGRASVGNSSRNGFRSRSEVKANRIVKFHVDEDNGTITITYTNGETVTESLGNRKGKASIDLSSMDADYMSAVERGDMETAQRMVDEAAKEAGYNYHLYHGTNADFTKFDLRKYGGRNGKGEGYGIYLAANREISAPYGKNVIDSFVKFNRLAEGRRKTLSYNEVKSLVKRSCEIEAQRMVDDEEYDSVSEALRDTWVSNIVYTYDYSNISQVYADVANKLWKGNDNDGDLINEIMALSGAHYDYNNALNFYDNILTPITGIDGFHYIWGNKDGSGEQNDIYLAFRSEQVKSADPVTYDDNRKVIPLSERFNSENADIRFSQDLFEDMNEGDVETDTEAVERELSPREQLAAMLESDDMSPAQKGMLTKYKNKLSQIEANEAEIARMNAQLDELKRNGKGNTSRADVLRKKIRDLEKMNAVSESIILNLEATKHIKRLLERERKAAYAEGLLAGQMAQGKDTAPALRKTEEELAGKKQSLAELRQKRKDDLDALAKRYQESIQKRTEGRRQTKLRNDIKRVVAELDHLLRHGNKKSNVKLGLQNAVAAALEAFDIYAEKAERYAEDMAQLDAKIEAATDPIEIEALKALREKKQRNSELLADKLADMKKAYEDIHNNKEGENYPSYYRAEAKVIMDRITDVMSKVGNTPIGEMTSDQLKAVYDMYRVVLTTVRDANKAFIDGKLEDLTENASDMTAELQKIKKLPEERLKAGDSARGFVWNELTPYYAFKRIGSKTLMRYYEELVRGQDVYARDLDEAKKFAEDLRKRYKAGSWNRNKIVSFKDKDGRDFRLNLGQMMSIYAYSKREQALDHLENGGFFFNNKETFRTKGGIVEFIASNETGYKIDAAALSRIKSALTADQIAYVDEMQAYLTKMGEKGNEVSRKMWGIDIFNEKVYFPLKSMEDFIYQANTPAETSSLKNDGMTKETKPHASNPIVLESFDEVWANHVEKMSRYHGFVIPIDNLNKIINYGSWIDGEAQSISTMLEARFSSAVNDYLNTFIKDLNGAKAQNGGLLGIMSNWLTKFKKTTVAAALSVAVQQPTAIIRASSEIDAKYFAHLPKAETLNKKWEKIKKYAPIAIIKDIGGFDAGSGKQITEWLNADTQQGVKKAMNKLDDLTMYGAALGDRLGWGAIWSAVEREVQVKQKLQYGTEEFYKACGKRFTEVIVKTQVYDSTLSRSGFMRGKDGLLKMATAFMGEPTLSINMLADTLLQAKRGTIKKGQAVRTVAAVYAATVAASIVKSLIYAMRDDDDDEAYLEKYAQALGGTILSDINPLGMLPVFRDVLSIMEGWDVERTDMAIVQDIYNAITALDSENKTTWRKIEDLAGAFAALAGVPAKNLLRTAREMYNAFNDIFDGIEGGDIGGAFIEGVTGKEKSKSQTLYEALISGDAERIAAIRNDYKTDKDYEAAIRKALRSYDPRIKKAAQAYIQGDIVTRNDVLYEIVEEGVFDEQTVAKAISAEVQAIEDAGKNEDVKNDDEFSLYTASDIALAFDYGSKDMALDIIAELIEIKLKKKLDEARETAEEKGKDFDEYEEREEIEYEVISSLRSSLTKHYKPLYYAAYLSGDSKEMNRIRDILITSELYEYKTDRDVDDVLEEWIESYEEE